ASTPRTACADPDGASSCSKCDVAATNRQSRPCSSATVLHSTAGGSGSGQLASPQTRWTGTGRSPASPVHRLSSVLVSKMCASYSRGQRSTQTPASSSYRSVVLANTSCVPSGQTEKYGFSSNWRSNDTGLE